MDSSKKSEQNKISFIKCLIRYRDYFIDCPNDELIRKSESKNLNDILSCYFAGRRPLVSMGFSYYFTNYDAAEYINDIVLDYIHEEVDILCSDWRQMYVLREDEENLYKDEEELL